LFLLNGMVKRMSRHNASFSYFYKLGNFNTTAATKFFRLFIFQVLLCFSSASYADLFEEGLNAFGGEKYKMAYLIWKPLAEKGDAAAQYYMGIMYANGQGVEQDFVVAYAWYSIAAEEQDFAEENRDDIERSMSLAQLEKAKKLVKEFNRKFETR